ncbi:MAG: hypothetical protein V4622_09135 [Bacteroidota bacterium]
MKKTVLTLIIFMSLNNPHAQLELVTGYSRWAFKSPSFNNFNTNYNNVVSSTNTETLDKFSAINKMFFELGVGLTGIDVRASYSPINTTSSATFMNGEKRIFNINGSLWQWEIGARKVTEQGYFGIYTGMAVTGFNTRMDSYYVYADGTKSYGNDKFINASFEEGGAAMILACRFGVGTKNVKLIGSFGYIGVLSKWANGNGGIDLKDNFHTMFIYGTKFGTNYLIEQYSQANQDINANAGNLPNVKSEFLGWYLRLGLEIDLFRNNY